MTILDADSGTVFMDELDFLEQCVFRLAILRKLEAVKRDLEAWKVSNFYAITHIASQVGTQSPQMSSLN